MAQPKHNELSLKEAAQSFFEEDLHFPWYDNPFFDDNCLECGGVGYEDFPDEDTHTYIGYKCFTCNGTGSLTTALRLESECGTPSTLKLWFGQKLYDAFKEKDKVSLVLKWRPFFC